MRFSLPLFDINILLILKQLSKSKNYDKAAIFRTREHILDTKGGGTQADSIMDRIIHNAYEIPTSETSLRKIYDSKKLKRLIDEIES